MNEPSRNEIPYFRSPLPHRIIERAGAARIGAIKAKGALVHAYCEDWHEDYAVADMLTDLRHYCDAAGIDFADQDRAARAHYVAELAERLGLSKPNHKAKPRRKE